MNITEKMQRVMNMQRLITDVGIAMLRKLKQILMQDMVHINMNLQVAQKQHVQQMDYEIGRAHV